MGSRPNEPQRNADEAQVLVTLTRGLWMGKFEVTQGQWKQIAGKLPGALTKQGGEGERLPVYNVSYDDAESFCAKLPGGNDPDFSSVKGTKNQDGTYSRVRRGGAWCDDGRPCRSAFRLRFEPDRRSDHIGFRVALVSN